MSLTDPSNKEQSKKSPQEVLVELAKEREAVRRERRETEPGTPLEARLSGYESGLKEAIQMFEDLDEFSKSEHLPEWQIGIENTDGEWKWYYVNAMRREKAKEKAKEKARDELGNSLDIYEISGPIAK